MMNEEYDEYVASKCAVELVKAVSGTMTVLTADNAVSLYKRFYKLVMEGIETNFEEDI